MRTITLEEHFAVPGFFDGPGRDFKERAQQTGGRDADFFNRLADIGAKRLAEMDAAGIDMQVLSLQYPGTEQCEEDEAIAVAREANDYPCRRREEKSDRFAGFATLADRRARTRPPPELERMVRDRLQGSDDQRPHIAAAISTTSSSGRSWSAPSSSTCPSTCTRRRRPAGHRGLLRRLLAERELTCSPAPAGAGTSKPPSTSCA